jgi:hypothetical protein
MSKLTRVIDQLEKFNTERKGLNAETLVGEIIVALRDADQRLAALERRAASDTPV